MSFRPGPLDIEIAEMEHHGIEPRVLQIAASIDAAISMKTPSPHYAEIRYRADLHRTRAVEMRIFSRALGDHRTGRRYAHALTLVLNSNVALQDAPEDAVNLDLLASGARTGLKVRPFTFIGGVRAVVDRACEAVCASLAEAELMRLSSCQADQTIGPVANLLMTAARIDGVRVAFGKGDLTYTASCESCDAAPLLLTRGEVVGGHDFKDGLRLYRLDPETQEATGDPIHAGGLSPAQVLERLRKHFKKGIKAYHEQRRQMDVRTGMGGMYWGWEV